MIAGTEDARQRSGSADRPRRCLPGGPSHYAAAKLSEREAVFAERFLPERRAALPLERLAMSRLPSDLDAREMGARVRAPFFDKRGAEFAGSPPRRHCNRAGHPRLEEAGRGMAEPVAGRIAAARSWQREKGNPRACVAWTDSQKAATARC